MPANTPSRSYTYATSGDANDLALITQRLAEQVDADVQTLYTSRDAQIPAGKVYRNTSFSVPNAVWTEISAFSGETYRRGGINYVSPRYVVPKSGIYMFACQVNWGGNSTGRRGTCPTIDGVTNSTAYGDQDVRVAGSGSGVNQVSSAVLYLTAGQAIGLQVYQQIDGGGALGVQACQFSVTWMGN